MARHLGWFDQRNARQRKKDSERYVSRMFPLGDEQKEKELALLKELIPSMKPLDSLYQLLQIKDILLSDDKEWEQSDWEETVLSKRLDPEVRRILFALAESSIHWQSLEQIPTAEEFRKTL